jgi:hypothetical protein
MSRLSSSAPSSLLRDASHAKSRLAAPPRPRVQNVAPSYPIASEVDHARPVTVNTPILFKGTDVDEVMRSWQSISDSSQPVTDARTKVDGDDGANHESFSIQLAGLSVSSNALDDEHDEIDTSRSLTDRASSDVSTRPSIFQCLRQCFAQCFRYK